MNWLGRILGKTPLADAFAGASDVSGSSLLALSRRQAALGEALRAHIYAYDGKTFLITSITRPDDGPSTETGLPSVLPIETSNEVLGRIVCDHLLAYAVTKRIDARHVKLSDWKVFQASGAKSGKSFESKSHIFRVSTLHQCVKMEAAPYRREIDGFCVKGSGRPVHEDVGALVRRTLRGVEALREKGLM